MSAALRLQGVRDGQPYAPFEVESVQRAKGIVNAWIMMGSQNVSAEIVRESDGEIVAYRNPKTGKWSS